jgi:hypothetical protein
LKKHWSCQEDYSLAIFLSHSLIDSLLLLEEEREKEGARGAKIFSSHYKKCQEQPELQSAQQGGIAWMTPNSKVSSKGGVLTSMTLPQSSSNPSEQDTAGRIVQQQTFATTKEELQTLFDLR